MDLFEDVRELINDLFNQSNRIPHFEQYLHKYECRMPCNDCGQYYYRLYEEGQHKPPVGEAKHPHCDCYYALVRQLLAGTISIKGEQSPDLYLKKYGVLPDYYITKEEAINVYHWDKRINKLSDVAAGKMIGGIVYKNKKQLLPEKEGRIWYECDVDYESGKRNSKRLFYSNDGLMFYSPDHGQTQFYQIV